MKILVLCHGNVNRSALCAAVLRDEGLTEVRSAALKPNTRPHRATRKMREAAIDRGYDLDSHRAAEVTSEDIEWAQLIIYMDNGNYSRLAQRLDMEGLNRATHCLAMFAEPSQERIPDPNFWKGDDPRFQSTVDLIISCSKRLADTILTAERDNKTEKTFL